MTKQLLIKSYFQEDKVFKKFEELLGNRASGFITSVLQAVSNNDMLKEADPTTIFHAAATAAVLDLPINANLGFAYIIPYRDRNKGVVAQFQVGYKGFVQLAQRSGQYRTISATEIYEGQLIEENPLTGFVFDFTKKKSDTVIGYAAYFELLNGFKKVLYMSNKDLQDHGTKFSSSYKKGFGLWKDDFHSMATKTVIKLLLSKYGPLTVDMRTAMISDQGIINDSAVGDVTYIDNEASPEEIKAMVLEKKAALKEGKEKNQTPTLL